MKFAKPVPPFDGARFEPAWNYTAAGVLWQIHHNSPSAFVGESRRMEEKTASFFCIDRITGRSYWENLNPADQWWSGIEAVHEDVVLIHGFASPDLPLHRGITAIELISGKTLWSRPDVRFSGIKGPAVTVIEEGDSAGSDLLLDTRSGAAFEGAGENEPPRVEPVPAMVPVLADADRISAVESSLPARVLRESVAVLETDNIEVWGYCTGDEERQKFRSELAVLEKGTKSERYRDVLVSDAAVASSGQFFVQEGILYYVKNRSRLVAVPLRNR